MKVSASDDPQVTRAVGRLRADVTGTLGAGAVFIDISPGTSPEIVIATSEVTPSVTGLYLHPGEADAQLAARLADTVQDCVMESRKHWGKPWPRCPDPTHHHPLDASDANTGSWICPATGRVVAEIGHLRYP